MMWHDNIQDNGAALRDDNGLLLGFVTTNHRPYAEGYVDYTPEQGWQSVVKAKTVEEARAVVWAICRLENK
jgi:hypothetical protein